MVFGIWKEGMVDKCLGRYGVPDESLVRMDMERGKEETNINEMDDTGNGELIRTHKSHRTYGPAFGLHLHSRLNRMNIPPRSDIWLIHRRALRCINMMMNDTCHYITTILFIQPEILLE